MNKQLLQLDEITARRLYPTAAPEFKELLAQNFGGKEFFNQDITDRINNYDDVLKISGLESADDKVNIKGFDDGDNKFITAIIQKVRVNKILNGEIQDSKTIAVTFLALPHLGYKLTR